MVDLNVAFYHGMMECLKQLATEPRTRNDWIIALTDGDDNQSNSFGCTAKTVECFLRTADVGVVIIGIGEDVQSQV